MLNGQKLEAIQKRDLGAMIAFLPHILESNSESVTRFINHVDQWAEAYGYEYHSMTETCVVFKRVGG